MRCMFVICVVLLLAGCFEEVKLSPPPPKAYFKPRVFSANKISINPYRDPKTFGPRSPYKLEYDEEAEVYRIVPRKSVLAPPPPQWTHKLIYE